MGALLSTFRSIPESKPLMSDERAENLEFESPRSDENADYRVWKHGKDTLGLPETDEVWRHAAKTFDSSRSAGTHCTNMGGRSARVDVFPGGVDDLLSGIRVRFYKDGSGSGLRDSDKESGRMVGLWRRTSKQIEIVDGSVLVQHLKSDELKEAFANESRLLEDLINFVQNRQVSYWQSQSDDLITGYVCCHSTDTKVEALVGGTRISIRASYYQADH